MNQTALASHRGALVLVLGILGIMFWITAPIAWILGRGDLREMDAGRMDPEGRSLTQAGTIIGMVITIIGVLGFLIWIFLFVLIGGIAVTSGAAAG